MAESNATRCTWEDCTQEAVVPQTGRDGEVWASLCAEHDQKLKAAEKSGRSPQILSCWTKAQGGAQEKPMAEDDPVKEPVPPARSIARLKYKPRPRPPQPPAPA